MNDENTLRTYGKKTDAYTVFSKMLKRGHPPADWESLTQETERKPLMVFTMPAERIGVDQRASFLIPRPESLQPQPFAVLPGYPQECLINNDHVDTLSINDLM